MSRWEQNLIGDDGVDFKPRVLVGAEPFLREIIANRHDNVPRLVFADWLDERGFGLRAEFIRVQVGIDEWQKEMLSPSGTYTYATVDGINRINGLKAREKELLDLDPRDIGWVPFVKADWFFERGFAIRLLCTPSNWLRYERRVVTCQPLIVVTLNFSKRTPFHARYERLACYSRRRPTLAFWGEFNGLWHQAIGGKYNDIRTRPARLGVGAGDQDRSAGGFAGRGGSDPPGH